MKQAILTFLGEGGFKLLFIGVVLGAQFLRARAKIAEKREATLRGKTQFDDLEMVDLKSPPANLRGQTQFDDSDLVDLESPVAAPSPRPPGAIAPNSASPWSNLDAFDGRKP